jgi:hypothetical protein
VHALRHVHELLTPGGTLVDLHPVNEERLEAEGRMLGVIEEPEWLNVDLPNAEARVRDAVDARIYALEAELAFELLQHFDDAEELLAAKQEPLEAQPDVVARIRAAAPPFVTREDFVLWRLRRLPR